MKEEGFNNYDKDLLKEFLDIFLRGMKKENSDNMEEEMKNLFNNRLEKFIKEEMEKEDISNDILKIGNHRFVKFREISDREKISDIWIDIEKIITIFDYNGEVAIRIDTPEFFIYKVEGSIEEVLNKLRD